MEHSVDEPIFVEDYEPENGERVAGGGRLEATDGGGVHGSRKWVKKELMVG